MILFCNWTYDLILDPPIIFSQFPAHLQLVCVLITSISPGNSHLSFGLWPHVFVICLLLQTPICIPITNTLIWLVELVLILNNLFNSTHDSINSIHLFSYPSLNSVSSRELRKKIREVHKSVLNWGKTNVEGIRQKLANVAWERLLRVKGCLFKLICGWWIREQPVVTFHFHSFPVGWQLTSSYNLVVMV